MSTKAAWFILFLLSLLALAAIILSGCAGYVGPAKCHRYYQAYRNALWESDDVGKNAYGKAYNDCLHRCIGDMER